MTACPKPRPHALVKADRKFAHGEFERAENAKVKMRSGGRCEVDVTIITRAGVVARRCARRASDVHHLMGGIGRRGVGASSLALHKLHVCDRCHAEITGHILRTENNYDRYDAATVRYERVR